MYRIKFSDGTLLENLKLNGSNFISDIGLSEEFFAGKLNGITITCDTEEEAQSSLVGYHEHMKLCGIQHYVGDTNLEDGYYFVLIDIPKEEYELSKLKSDLEYTAMMSDIDLE